MIKVDLDKYLNKNNEDKILLQNLDRFVVHANLNFFERENIKIVGEVNIPGSYPVLKNNETLSSIIERAGGLTPKANLDGISIFRDLSNQIINNLKNNLIILKKN